MHPPLIIYHGNCPDGFGAAWLLGKSLGPHEKFAASYGQPAPMHLIERDRDVWIVDFCYPPNELHRIAEMTQMIILDHHETALDYTNECRDILNLRSSYEALDKAPAIGKRGIAVIDPTHSGIGIVAQWVACDIDIPHFVKNIEDRDLWRFALRDTREIFAAVTSHPYTDEAWDSLAEKPWISLLIEGEGIERYRQRLIQQCVDIAYQHDFMTPSDPEGIDPGFGYWQDRFGYWQDIWVANAPYAICSDVAGELAKRDPGRFAATFVIDEQGPKWSLRSTDEGMNVAEIAARMQPGIGGGHAHAAGFRGAWW